MIRVTDGVRERPDRTAGSVSGADETMLRYEICRGIMAQDYWPAETYSDGVGPLYRRRSGTVQARTDSLNIVVMQQITPVNYRGLVPAVWESR